MPLTRSETAKRNILRGLEWLDAWHAIGGSIELVMQKGGKLDVAVPVGPPGHLGPEDRRKMIALLRDFDLQTVTMAVDLRFQASSDSAVPH